MIVRWPRKLIRTVGALAVALFLGLVTLTASGTPAKAATGLAACWDLIAQGIDPDTIEMVASLIANHQDCVEDLDNPTFDGITAALLIVYLADKQTVVNGCQQVAKAGSDINNAISWMPDPPKSDLLAVGDVVQYANCACTLAESGLGEKVKDIKDDVTSCIAATTDIVGALGGLLINAFGSIFNDLFDQPQDCTPCIDCSYLPNGVCTTAGEQGAQEENNCGTPWYLPFCRCPALSTPLASPANDGAFICECPQGEGYVSAPGPGGNIEVCMQCPSNAAAPGDGPCQCNVQGAQIQLVASNQAQPCPAGPPTTAAEIAGCTNGSATYFPLTAVCRCPDPKQGAINGQCQNCPSGCSAGPTSVSFWTSKQDANGTCSDQSGAVQQCPPGTKGAQFGPNSCGCVPACDNDSVMLPGTTSCHQCASTEYPTYDDGSGKSSDGHCDTCPSGEIYYPPTGQLAAWSGGNVKGCSCPIGQCPTAGGQCAQAVKNCPAGQHPDPFDCSKCDNWCPGGSTFLGLNAQPSNSNGAPPQLGTWTAGNLSGTLGFALPNGGPQPICQPCAAGDIHCGTCLNGSTPDGNGGCKNFCGTSARYVPTVHKGGAGSPGPAGGASINSAPAYTCVACAAGQQTDRDDLTKCTNICPSGQAYTTALVPAGGVQASGNPKFGMVNLAPQSSCTKCESGKTDPHDATNCVPPLGKASLPATGPGTIMQIEPDKPGQALQTICGGDDVALIDGKCCPRDRVSSDRRFCIAAPPPATVLPPPAGVTTAPAPLPPGGVIFRPQPPGHSGVLPRPHARPGLAPVRPRFTAPRRRCAAIRGKIVCR